MFFYCFVVIASSLLAVARYLDNHKKFKQLGKRWVLLEFAFPMLTVIIFGLHIAYGYRCFDYIILAGALAQMWIERIIANKMEDNKKQESKKPKENLEPRKAL